MQAKLVMFKEGHRKDFDLSSGTTTIGRKEDCGLRIPLNDISRVHCQVTVKDDAVILKDLGSANGTFVNDRRVSEQQLRPGDIVKVGPVTFTVQINGRPAEIVPPDQLAEMLGDDSGDLGELEEVSETELEEIAEDESPEASGQDPLDALELLEIDDSDDDLGDEKK